MLGKEHINKLSIFGEYTLRKTVIQVKKVINMNKITLKLWCYDSKMSKAQRWRKYLLKWKTGDRVYTFKQIQAAYNQKKRQEEIK